MEFKLRDFRQEDFQTLWKIDQKCFPPGIAYSQRELRFYIGHPRSFTVVAVSSQPEATPPILGFIVADSGRGGMGHIITIDVVALARRSGTGSKLLHEAEQRMCASACHSVYLETAVDNLTALAFYKKHGYFVVKTVPRYYSNGVDALVLQKELLSEAEAS